MCSGPGNTYALLRYGLPGGAWRRLSPTYLLLFLGRVICPDRAAFFLPALRWRKVITSCLCERSLTRVLGSVTLEMDKARKGAWSEEGKGSAAHTRGKPG